MPLLSQMRKRMKTQSKISTHTHKPTFVSLGQLERIQGSPILLLYSNLGR